MYQSTQPLVMTDKNVLMQRLCDCVGNGYPLWISGGAAENKVESLVSRFNLNYQILADRNERTRRKRAGLGNAKLLLWHDENAARVVWWMFVTPPDLGGHGAHALEKLHDMRERERVEFQGFELIKLPQKGQERERLTWRMNENKYAAWRESIIDNVRSKNIFELKKMLYGLASSPGFSGIRSQSKKLVRLYKAEVKRKGLKDAPMITQQFRYNRRLRNKGTPLTQWARQHGQH